MNTAEPVRLAVSITLAVAVAFVGLHAALTASNWFAAYGVLPVFRGQESLRAYMLFGGHVAYIATSIVVGLVLSLAVGSQVWAGTTAFLGAVIFFVVDWEQRGG